MTMDFQSLAKGYEEAMLADLFELLRIPSEREDDKATPEAPFGPGPKAALEQMLAFGRRDGLAGKNVNHKTGVLYAGEGDESVGVIVHLDVVPATGDWDTPPYAPEIRDGRLYARGAADDKGPAMAAYYGLKILLDQGVPLNRQVHFIFGTDEESNWECLTDYFKHEPMPTLGFSPDADFPIINGEKGMLDLKLVTHPQKDPASPLYLRLFEGGIRSNMVAERATARLQGDVSTLKALTAAWQEMVAREPIAGQSHLEEGELVLEAVGKSAHGAEPEVGINACTYLAAFLSDHPLNDSARAWCTWIRERLHLATDGHHMNIDSHDEVMGDVTINAGVFRWQDGESEIITNNRYPRSTNQDSLIAGYKAHFGESGIAIGEILTDKPVHYIPADDPLVEKLLDVYHRQTGLEPYPMSIGGGTYARMMDRGVAYGPFFPGEPSSIHQANESASLDNLFRSMAIYAEAIYELTR